MERTKIVQSAIICNHTYDVHHTSIFHSNYNISSLFQYNDYETKLESGYEGYGNQSGGYGDGSYGNDYSEGYGDGYDE